MQIDLNADLGEGVGDDDGLLEIVTSANIATGAHAGGGAVLVAAVAAAADREVAIGAHPSYRDRHGFGRTSQLTVVREDAAAAGALTADLAAQILVVAREAERHGRALTHVKAHGALYNEAARDAVAARVILDAMHEAGRALGYPLAVLTLPGGKLARLGVLEGLRVIAEGFADRGYTRTAELVPRGEPGAVLAGAAEMVVQALALAAGHVDPVDGPRVSVGVESLCVHGDTPGAVAAARAIRVGLRSAGWEVVAPAGRAAATTRTRPAGLSSAPGSGGANGNPAELVVLPFGDRALLIEPSGSQPPGTEWVLRVAARAHTNWPGATVVPGLASVLVAFDGPDDRPPRGNIDFEPELGSRRIGRPDRSHATTPGIRSHTFATRYQGPDLAEVAALLGLPAEELVRRHAAATWTVAAIGFSPGFGYLTSTDPLFRSVPRRADPRTRVPAGGVALAAGMCAVYPSATPGGWQLIGTTTAVLFEPSSGDRPALLRAGDSVTFHEAT